MPINIKCDECDCCIEEGDDVICRKCYQELVADKDQLEDELQKKIDDLEEELAEIKSQFEI